MFSIRYIEKDKKTPNGQIFCEIFEEASWIYSDEDLPFIFEILEEDKSIWRKELSPNMWASWHCEKNENISASIRDKKGNVLSGFYLDIWVNRNSTEQFFDTWVSKNQTPNGIIIGTHDGTSGEWVKHVRKNSVNVVLVEGSEKQYDSLVKNYCGKKNVKFRNDVVTPSGGFVNFYEFGDGFANTTNKNHFERHKNDSKSEILIKESIGINDLIIEEGLESKLDFLHLDTESIDDEILMALDFKRIKKPKLIVLETINFSEERTGNSDRMNKLSSWLYSNGYKFKYDYWNSFAFLND